MPRFKFQGGPLGFINLSRTRMEFKRVQCRLSHRIQRLVIPQRGWSYQEINEAPDLPLENVFPAESSHTRSFGEDSLKAKRRLSEELTSKIPNLQKNLLVLSIP